MTSRSGIKQLRDRQGFAGWQRHNFAVKPALPFPKIPEHSPSPIFKHEDRRIPADAHHPDELALSRIDMRAAQSSGHHAHPALKTDERLNASLIPILVQITRNRMNRAFVVGRPHDDIRTRKHEPVRLIADVDKSFDSVELRLESGQVRVEVQKRVKPNLSQRPEICWRKIEVRLRLNDRTCRLGDKSNLPLAKNPRAEIVDLSKIFRRIPVETLRSVTRLVHLSQTVSNPL